MKLTAEHEKRLRGWIGGRGDDVFPLFHALITSCVQIKPRGALRVAFNPLFIASRWCSATFLSCWCLHYDGNEFTQTLWRCQTRRKTFFQQNSIPCWKWKLFNAFAFPWDDFKDKKLLSLIVLEKKQRKKLIRNPRRRFHFRWRWRGNISFFVEHPTSCRVPGIMEILLFSISTLWSHFDVVQEGWGWEKKHVSRSEGGHLPNSTHKMEQRAEPNHAQIKVEVLCNVKERKMKKNVAEPKKVSPKINGWMKGKIPMAFVWDYQNEYKGDAYTEYQKGESPNKASRECFPLSLWWEIMEKLNKVPSKASPFGLRYLRVYRLH